MRLVTVKFLTPVFAEVDLDAEPDANGGWPDDAVVRVQHGDSEIHRVDDDLPDWLDYIGITDPIGVSYSSSADETPSPDELTPEERQKAIDIAENTMWPQWEGY
jgi:hypothetical protein